MALLNHSTRELTAKVVYYGPGLCGKTTNLKYIYDNLEEDLRGPMLSLATEADRTLFFDFLPLDLGSVRGFKVRVQLYTVPGQVFYEETRKRVLKGADGVVFVADSQRSLAEANRASFDQMERQLADNGTPLSTIPLVLQYNKRDLPDIMTLEEMDRRLNPGSTPFFEAIANEGVGVEDTFRAITRLVLKNLVSHTLGTEAAEHAMTASAVASVGPRPVPSPPPPAPIRPDPPALRAADPTKGLDLFGDEEEGVPWQEETTGERDALLDSAFPLEAVLEDEDEESLPTALVVEADPVPAFPAPEAMSPAPDPVPGTPREGLALHPRVGEPLEMCIEIEGKRFRLTITLEPEP